MSDDIEKLPFDIEERYQGRYCLVCGSLMLVLARGQLTWIPWDDPDEAALAERYVRSNPERIHPDVQSAMKFVRSSFPVPAAEGREGEIVPTGVGKNRVNDNKPKLQSTRLDQMPAEYFTRRIDKTRIELRPGPFRSSGWSGYYEQRYCPGVTVTHYGSIGFGEGNLAFSLVFPATEAGVSDEFIAVAQSVLAAAPKMDAMARPSVH